MFSRLILLVVIGILAYSLYKKLAKSKTPTQTPSQPADPTEMKRCAKCGVHLPISESIQYQTLHFCCEDHKKAYLLDHSAGDDK